MTKKNFEVTSRGFKVYGSFIDRYKSKIRVQESSIVGPCVWIFVENDGMYSSSLHLTVENVKSIIEALQQFINDVGSENNGQHNPDYKTT